MAKKKRVGPGQRLKLTMVQAFNMWRPFEREFREQVGVVQAKTIELAETTAGLDHVSENVRQLATDLLASADSLEKLMEKQFESVAELGVSSMKMKEIEDDPERIGELMIDAATIIANWETLVRVNSELLAQSLKVALPPTRDEALKRLPDSLLDEWLDAILEIKAAD